MPSALVGWGIERLAVKIVIEQSDLVTAYGWGMEPLWSGLLAGKSAIRATTLFAQRGFVSDQAAIIADLDTSSDAGKPACRSRVMAMLRRLLAPLVGRFDPLTPILLATIVGEIEYVERAVLNDETKSLAASRPERLLEKVKNMLGLRGPGMVVSSACASSTAAVALAASMVRSGRAQKVLVVACDAISEFVYSGFSGLLSLSAQPARPFDADRDGLSLGEGAAWALVSAEPRTDPSPKRQRGVEHRPAAREGAEPRGQEPAGWEGTEWTAEILGWASTTDAVHMTATDRHAQGLCRAIQKTCMMAKRSPKDVAFIAAHGPGTPFSDAMEMTAFKEVFGKPRPVFSTKGGTGHTLGAAGLVQLLVACNALATGIVPPTVGLTTPDPLALGWVSNKPATTAKNSLALSANSGFGGVNTAILLEGKATS